ncbi:High-affinity methionine permease [Cercospora zeina]
MAGFTVSSLWRRVQRQHGQESDAATPTGRRTEDEKQFAVQQQRSTSEHSAFESNEPDYLDHQPQVGELKPGEAEAGGLGRHLGLFSTTFLIIGRIIGTGIFSTPSSITHGVGSVGAAMMLWILGLFIAFAGLFIWLELGCMIPRSGGEKVYLEAAYRRPKLFATTIFAFQIVLLGFTASGCVVAVQYIFKAADKVATEWEKRSVALLILTFICSLHAFRPGFGVRFMNGIGVIKIIVLLFIVITGFVVLGGGIKHIPHPRASFQNSFAGTSSSGYQWSNSLFKVLNSFAGYTNAMYVLNEVKDPIRTIKIAGPLGLAICGTFYLLANVAYFAASTPEEVAKSGVTVAALFMDKVFGHRGQQAISVLIAISAFGNVMTVTFAQARVNQELAKEGVLPYPKFWASNWPFRSPSAGLFLHWIPSFIVIIAIPFGDAYNFILDMEGYPGSVVNFFVVVGFFWLRYKSPDVLRPFRCWWPIAAFFMVAQAFQMIAPFLRPPGGKGDTSLPYYLSSVVGLVVLVAGAGWWVVWRKILPAIGRYDLVPEREKLDDGTMVVVYNKRSTVHEHGPAIGVILQEAMFPIFRLERMPRESERVFVAEKKAEIRRLGFEISLGVDQGRVQKRRELKMIPEFAFVDEELAGFLLVLVHTALGVGDGPDGVIGAGTSDVRPENGAVLEVLGGLPERVWSDDRDIVGIEKEGLGEAGVHHGSGFELIWMAGISRRIVA